MELVALETPTTSQLVLVVKLVLGSEAISLEKAIASRSMWAITMRSFHLPDHLR